MVEGDEDVEQEDPTHSAPPEPMSRDTSEPILPTKELPSKAPSPKPHPLSISFAPDLAVVAPEQADDDVDDGGLSGALQGLEAELAGQVDVVVVPDPLGAADLVDLDLSQLGPDGTAFGADDLTQLQPDDGILGTADMVLDTGISDDPFAIEHMEPS